MQNTRTNLVVNAAASLGQLKRVLAVMTLLLAAIFASADVRTFGQRWMPWAPNTLGFGPGTIGSDGCAITCIASVRDHFGAVIDPGSMNTWGKANGGFSGNLVVWGKYRGYRTMRDYSAVAADLNFINANLDQGNLCIVKTYMGVNRNYAHWVLLYGHSGSTYYMMDPWTGDKTTFNARYGSPSRWIYRVVVYGPA